ncbi:hypothetical protein [Adhaeribacter arboris]|uniref:hypothetical protein n=1 Tax=Adhaeribacter arboris TaxID=2072846 RepID=UPI0011B25F06|nr:hypothetical protein [Adhaeribacter arboris]
MIFEFENDLLFDDRALLENKLGAGCLSNTDVNTDCDCSGYTAIPDDEGTDPAKSSGTAA